MPRSAPAPVLQDLIAGFCRFSYLGRSDWASVRRYQQGPLSPAALDELAQGLFAPDRLARRFASFERITLPSIAAQTDPAFLFVVLASDRLPQPWRDRLERLCATVPAIELRFTGEPDLGNALAPILRELEQMTPRNLIQFRLDDDDALPVDFVARLRRMAGRMTGLDQFGLSIASGLAVAVYPGRGVVPLVYDIPFLGLGVAVSLPRPARTIFALGHLRIPDRMTTLLDREGPGGFMLKWPSDSRAPDLDALPPALRRSSAAEFDAALAQHFPFLRGVDFQAVARGEV